MTNKTNISIAKLAMERSKRWLMSALRALEDERWDDAVYSAQMAVEQSSKAVLIALGIEYPKEHDVSIAFKQISKIKGIPEWFKGKIRELTGNISELAEIRGIAAYGYEIGINAEHFKEYAPKAYEKAKEHIEACQKLLNQIFKEP